MTHNRQGNGNLQIAQKIQQQFDFYFVGLIFTILGLSIQSAKFDSPLTANISELIGWLALLISGIAGISRLEWIPAVYKEFADQDTIDEAIKLTERDKAVGKSQVYMSGQNEPTPIDSYLERGREVQSMKKDRGTKLEKRLILKYDIQKYAFTIGISSLVFARAFVPLLKIFEKVRVCLSA